ncbi:MAG: hypothetical protein ACYCRH_08135 [Acidiferrobacteraceae bacterium]
MTRLRPRPSIAGARRDRRNKRTGTLLLTLSLTALSACTRAATHITVTREVFLERGHEILPRALVRTHDGGYVIAGFSGTPWATRVNAAGQVQWRYRAPRVPLKAGQVPGDSTYTGAVTLPDDSTLLCGYEPRPDQPYSVRALLTRISPHGRVLSVQMPDPNHDPGYVLSYIQRCVRWDKGVAVIGSTTLFPKGSTQPDGENYVWLLKLDGQGKIQWEKLIPDRYANFDPDQTLLTLSNGDLAIMTSLAHLRLVGPEGTVRAQRTIPFGLVAPSTRPERAVHVLTGGKHVTPAWLTLGDHLQDTQVAPLAARPVEIIPYKKAYRLSNGALALFGYTTPPEYGGMLLSSIAWISPDFGHKQIFTFKPWSIWVADAVPTGKPGEFATVRQVGPMQRPGEAYDRNQLGVVLAFVHIH